MGRVWDDETQCRSPIRSGVEWKSFLRAWSFEIIWDANFPTEHTGSENVDENDPLVDTKWS